MGNIIGPENGLPTQMPLVPPYLDRDGDFDPEVSLTVYDYKAEGDIVLPSDKELRRQQFTALVGSSVLGIVSTVNAVGAKAFEESVENHNLDAFINLITGTNIMVVLCSTYAAILSTVSIVRVKSFSGKSS